MKKIVECNIKCPKCKTSDLSLEEIWKGHFITWEVTNGNFDRNEGVLEAGDPYCVIASCKKCGRTWKVKNAIQISDCHN